MSSPRSVPQRPQWPESGSSPGDLWWAAYELFSWRAVGPERHGSFAELMYGLHAGFHALDRPQSQTRCEQDTKIEHARLASPAGEIDGPLAALKESVRFGRDRARILLFQLQAMLGARDASRQIEFMLLRGHEPSWTPDTALLSAEILPVLFAEHQRTDHCFTGSVFAGLAERGSDPVRRLVADYRAREAEPGFQVRFGNPEFDTAVRAALADRAGDDAWPLLRGALSEWRPMSDDHLAPVSLLADPRTARLITPERGREILAMRRG